MRIWLTPRFSDDAPEGIDTLEDPSGDVFSYVKAGLHITEYRCFQEGVTWHRTEAAAIVAAEDFRSKRISAAEAEAARLKSLPLLAA